MSVQIELEGGEEHNQMAKRLILKQAYLQAQTETVTERSSASCGKLAQKHCQGSLDQATSGVAVAALNREEREKMYLLYCRNGKGAMEVY